MKQGLFRTRRLGVALLAGVTSLGAAATFGEGVAGASNVTATSFAASSLIGSTGANWTVGFTTSAAGALAAGGSISIEFPTNFAATTSVTLGSGFTNCTATAVPGALGTGTDTITLAGATCAVANSTAVSLTVGATNGPAGTYSASATPSASAGFAVATSVDTTYEPASASTGSFNAASQVTLTSAVVPTVSATAASSGSGLGTGTYPGSLITVSIPDAEPASSGAPATNVISLTIPCPSSGSEGFNSAVGSSTATPAWGGTATATASSNGACGSAVDNVLTVSWTNPSSGASSIGVTPSYVLNGAPTGAINLAGAYVGSTSSTSFTVSDFTVSNVAVTPTTPVAAIAPGTGDAAVGNLTITMPTTTAFGGSAGPAAVCVTLVPTSGSPAGANPVFDTISGPSPSTSIAVQQINGAATGAAFVTGSTSQVSNAATSNGLTTSTAIGFSVASLGTGNPPVYVLSNLHVDIPANEVAGTVTVNVGYSTSVAGCAAPTAITNGLSAFVVGSAPGGAIYGQTAEATAASEFTTAFVSTSPTISCSNNGSAILATAADPYDALSASYLEGQLHTGVLITPVSTTGAIDPNVLAALKEAGVSRIYVVGGPDAVTTQEIATLQGTAAYACGGLAATGGNISVIPAATTGQTADQTAALIDSYVTGNGAGGLNGANNLPSLSSAFSSASTYNQTTGNASAAAPANVSGTAIVASNTDWQDADAISAVAYAYHLPVVLTSATALTATAQTELVKLGYSQVIVVGGQLAVTPAVVSAIQAINVTANSVSTPISVLRIAGQDASGTSADIATFEAKVLGWKQTTLYVAQGSTQGAGWGDSLVSAPLTGGSMQGLLLTAGPTAALPADLTSALTSAGTPPSGLGSGITTGLQQLGGPLAITAAQYTQMKSALAAG